MLDDGPQIAVSGGNVRLEDIIGRVGVDVVVGAGKRIAARVIGLMYDFLHVGDQRIRVEHHFLKTAIGKGVPGRL